jgi:hypothetical protein
MEKSKKTFFYKTKGTALTVPLVKWGVQLGDATD